ncbi:MAG: hypothetical protein UU46_C0041G0002 [Candidatus Uhrbacteria bacterium GW2011_GWD1_41_16]|uniref:Uncharacterized protein n=1 Tax=Candidatus Uhrbacteria bacterium GW2011_GWC1_41_20 TaxID=1618983 RepID=A0A0G0XM43_9BACT|nr:MAG: hypothetical protein UT52_C0023G0003 [Candidatus Uhrbacteria bacterium GW2011_GWE1_39_46]KKR63379.1 MAG: hypothetical protein UU04_C0019G0012 [Candidatus Uhrbacteria bacterium GW2011_GWC2_40_450]KKR88416.1 MAG: hypothetical protein UU36_C0044G0003 [Candidatus Uhrbacteria bacterium GW2011_GWE2_41_1153]KKR94049.1 MAG: hypothetical protein UU46_C0041G0002 [Candidatus Uhrbacteria bacterium GW2011_GWD1_41_16]KKR97865.1 MAG: hypothetical protein UU50_C0023G0011 [Candidatus Uhrbacteria bacteri
MKHSALKVTLCALVLGVIFDAMLYNSYEMGLNILLMQLAVLAVFYGMMHHAKLTISKQTVIASIFALLFAGTFVIWTSTIGLTLCTLGLLGANTFLVLFAWGHHGIFYHPLSIVADTMRYGIQTLITRFGIISDIRLPKTGERGSAIARGTLIAIPILIIFFLLFLSSDLMLQNKTQAIQTWLENIFGPFNLVAHMMIIVFFTLVFLLILASMFWKRLNIDLPEVAVSHSIIESTVILIGSNALFLFFLIFQGFYLFGGQDAFNTLEELTYSQYAVAGFNQLAVVAILVLLLILTLRYFHGTKINSKLVWISEVALLAQTAALLVSAWSRLTMYVEEYGFTPARLFGFWFFLLSGILLILLCIHIIRSTKQNNYITQALLIIGCAILIFTATSPDALTVRLNIARAQQTGELDAFPLFNDLSAEAYPLMDMVLSGKSYQKMIGVMDTKITDYCVFLEKPNELIEYTLVPNPEIDEDLAKDIFVRYDKELFYYHWLSTGEDAGFQSLRDDWRTWNLARALIPAGTETDNTDPIENIPYPTKEIANACGMYVGDAK